MARYALTTGQRSWVTRAFLLVLATMAIIVVTKERVMRLEILDRLETATLDYRFSYRAVRQLPKDSSTVVIVEIAEDSFRSITDKFPWPRSHYAHLLRNLKRAGARVVAIDLLFSDKDNYRPENDDTLRSAIRETGIAVLAGTRKQDNPNFVSTSAHEDYGNIFFAADSFLGLVNIRPDADGVYRFYNTSFYVDTSAEAGVSVPTLGFAALNRYLNLRPFTVPEKLGKEFLYAGRRIPQYDAASMLINFYGPNGTFPHIKFQDVLDDESFTTAEESSSGEQINTFSDPEFGYLADGTFRDKIVLVGMTVPEYKDLFPVSIGRGRQKGDNLMYGVEIHANVIENILRNDFLKTPSAETEIAAIFGFVVITFLVTSLSKSWKTKYHFMAEIAGFAFVAFLVLLIGVAALYAFGSWGVVLPVTPLLLAVAGGYLAGTTYYFIAERKQRLLIKSMFSTYVNPSIVDELIAHPEKLVLGGRREELTVLFSDIEGFTGISQDMEPENLVALLNEYLSVMSDIVFRNRGTLDKYEGDAIMAFWGAPIPQPDHALLACATALQMRDALTEVNRVWSAQGKPHLNIRIGINTGEMVVGNMGATGKFAYTVIGDSVNLASRLEGANKEFRTCIMVSERTYGLVKGEIQGRKLDRITVKGRSAPVTTYELMRMREGRIDRTLADFLALYDAGLRCYYERKWSEAAQCFESALRLRPDDPPARLHLARTETYRASPPPPEWDGVFAMKTK